MSRRDLARDGPADTVATTVRARPPEPAVDARLATLLTIQRSAGNAATTRMLARVLMSPDELRREDGPAELIERLTALTAENDPGRRHELALDLVDACDSAVAGGLPSATAAKVRALRRQAKEEGAAAYARAMPAAIPTFDTTDKQEKWTTADQPDRSRAKAEGDNRRFSQADASEGRQRFVFMSLTDVKSVEDIDKLKLDQIASINPQSIVPYRILHTVLHESWHVAKELLLDPAAPNENRRALMTKLWEYRQWHHQVILSEVMEELNSRQQDPEALKPSKGAGSATLSSDIDVNLKGTHTELAVPLFNALFKQSKKLPAHRWTNEPGVVYDVNVYAIDFMHSFMPRTDVPGRRTTQKEGAREGQAGGGVGDASLQSIDRSRQFTTSLFKARLFMDTAQWDAYKKATTQGLPVMGQAELGAAFRAAEFAFAGYLREMGAKMEVAADALGDKAASGVERLKAAAASKVPGAEHDHGVEASRENVLMVAANRIYEAKLAAIHAERAKLKTLIGRHNAAAEGDRSTTGVLIDSALLRLRQLVAEAAMYANEASMTDATIHHGVVGIQGGMEIDQEKSEGINAVNEHLADVMKEAGRYGPELGAGAYKAGKYLMRLGDAAKNLGFGYVWGVQTLYSLGRKLSEDIKVRADKGGIDTSAESAAAVRSIANVTTLDGLRQLAMETAALVTKEYMQERGLETRFGQADSATTFGHRTGAKKSENVHMLNKEMRHPADRASGAQPDLQTLPPEELAFQLSEAELDALKLKWAAAAAAQTGS